MLGPPAWAPEGLPGGPDRDLEREIYSYKQREELEAESTACAKVPEWAGT